VRRPRARRTSTKSKNCFAQDTPMSYVSSCVCSRSLAMNLIALWRFGSLSLLESDERRE